MHFGGRPCVSSWICHLVVDVLLVTYGDVGGGQLAPHHLTNPRIFQRVCYAQPVMLTCANYLLPGGCIKFGKLYDNPTVDRSVAGGCAPCRSNYGLCNMCSDTMETGCS